MKPSTVIVIIIIIIVIIAVAVIFTVGRQQFSPPPYTTTMTTQTTTVTQTKTTTTITQIPQGAYPIPYNPNNKTVFIYLVTNVQASFSFNNTQYGKLRIYVPTNWSIIITYTNYQSLNHNVIVLANTSLVPSSNIASNGKILLYVGANSSNYNYEGVSGGKSAKGLIKSLPAGYYWLACGVDAHASAGMWVVLVVSPSVSIPYAVIQTSTQTSTGSPPGYY
jgi:sulfocyanin